MSFEDFLIWARKREVLNELDAFYVYYDAYYEKTPILLEAIKDYLEPYYRTIYYNLALHYIIVTNYTTDEGTSSPLYEKYKIGEHNFITESATDNGSSAKMHINKAMDEGDFIMLDLLKTPYGTYVYSLLEQLHVHPIIL